MTLGKESDVNIKHSNSIVPAALRRRSFQLNRRASLTALKTGLVSAAGTMLMAAHAMAQATASTNGIGSQVQNMAQEGSTTGGFIASTAMYGGALICFVAGCWALWSSRQPQNREGGRVAMGAAGLVLCGLLVSGGAWINKAANTASGGNASITSTSGVVTFGGN